MINKENIMQENKIKVPPIVQKYGYDLPKDTEKVWALDIPVVEIPIEDITWHFSIPFWGVKDAYYSITVNDVIKNKDAYPEHYKRIINSETTYPVDLLDNREINGKLLMLDGLHRTVKLYLEGQKTIKAHIVSRNLIPQICKDGSILDSLNKIFTANKKQRICVIATSCAGKSTLVKYFPDALDMDEALFPLLTKEETDYVCQDIWTEEIGLFMDNLAKTKLQIKAGHPIFSTVLLDADLIVFLHINDLKLKERCQKRGSSFAECKNMQNKIEKELELCQKKVIKLEM